MENLREKGDAGQKRVINSKDLMCFTEGNEMARRISLEFLSKIFRSRLK